MVKKHVSKPKLHDEEHHRHIHEGSDVSTKGIAIFAMILAAIIIGTMIIAAGFFRFMQNQPAYKDERAPEAIDRAQHEAPLLQTKPAQELAEHRAHEEKILNSYGWINREAGIVRIPIERAMDLRLKDGYKARPQGGYE